jgi:NTE family protein
MSKNKIYKIDKLKRNNFSLVLSGGSSLGLAEIGAIKFLEKNSLQPSEIIGTSMGSIIGALYALGETSQTIQEKIKNLRTQDLFEIKYLQGRIEYKKAKLLLKNLFKNKKIGETKIPLKIIATKLKNGEEKIFTKKDNVKIYDAIIASTAIPGILNVGKIKREVYVDGCVSSSLPLEAAKKNNIKLAINVINRKEKAYQYKNPKNNFIKNILTKFEILRRASRYYVMNQTESKIKTTKKVILIEPNLKNFDSFKLTNHKRIIQAGYDETKKYFDKAEKIHRRKYKKEKTPLQKIMNFSARGTKKIIENIQKLE